nr:hypothetical protein GCM10020063_103030 [Dactylosporangium thailandense]
MAGPLGVARGFALGAALSWPVALLWLRRSTGLRVGRLFTHGLRALAALTVAGLAAALASAPLGSGWCGLIAAAVVVPACPAVLVVLPQRRWGTRRPRSW